MAPDRVAADRTRYRFGPLERRGLIAGWRGGQVASVASALLLAVLVLRSRPTAGGVAVAAVAVMASVALACWPVAGRTGEEWLPTVVRWSAERAAGGGVWRSTAPAGGRRRPRAPDGGPFAGLSILEVRGPAGGRPVGVLHDARARTYTGVLAIRGHSFALLGPAEQERRVGGWAAVLSSLAREGSVVHRLQWIAATIPDDGHGVQRHLERRAVRGPDDPARRSYAALLEETEVSACRHDVLLGVQIQANRATARAQRAAGGGSVGAAAVLGRELAVVQGLLRDADVLVERVLGPDEVARTIRRTGESVPTGGVTTPDAVPTGAVGPTGEVGPAADAGPPGDAGPTGEVSPGDRHPWPMAVAAEWGRCRTDETWHATYWVAEWPRLEVGPDFLGPLLLGPARRSVTMVMEPLSPGLATRKVEQARTADLADSELRRRGGFLSTARRASETEVVARREAELADGHASYRFSGYVTVTTTSPDQLDEACAVTEQAAGQARLELRRLYGDQARALTCTLPLGRGLS